MKVRCRDGIVRNFHPTTNDRLLELGYVYVQGKRVTGMRSQGAARVAGEITDSWFDAFGVNAGLIVAKEDDI